MGKRILCIDTELTCWENPEYQKAQTLEIIQFGLAEIDLENFEVSRTGSYYVSNTRHGISKFCYELTGISQGTLDKRGMPLAQVAELLTTKWGVGQPWNALVSWGDERAWMEPDFVAKSVPYPFHNGLFNLADYYRFSFFDNRRERASLKRAAVRYGVEVAEPQHNAEADALTLANLVLAMIRAGTLFPALKPSDNL
ncbi:3'-5' exonuclease [Ferrimonas balearica]|uniref:3'-5' exonuclease n=1 Tax=Ferrimonas balearica TaxID=44012 RepID=UPI001C99C2F4|nr:3'-5' exonuclease [Ferrimonas balearica]MBY5921556.1 exonuclease domain-containing protein [Ferrimonas balearica]MBY5995104.1 exonuclease domain-containing protein [Ferrimonas balearica]